MEFPITDLLDYENSAEWIHKHFHPKGQQCPKCHSPIEQSRELRRARSSDLLVQRCLNCGAIYNLYTGAVFQGSQWTPMQVVLFMRGICKGETTRELAAELQLNYKTVLTMRPFKGVHKVYLSGYVAMAEFRRNLKRISPEFIAALVTVHTVYTCRECFLTHHKSHKEHKGLSILISGR